MMIIITASMMVVLHLQMEMKGEPVTDDPKNIHTVSRRKGTSY